jgi:hypothetical protein
MGGRLLPRDPDDALAVGLQDRLALRVVASGLGRVVPPAAVRLDDEAVLRPAEVRDDAAPVEVQGHVDVRRRETRGGQQVVDAVLELAAGGGRIAGQHAGEARPAGTAGGPVELAPQTPQVREAPRLGAAHHPTKRLIPQARRHVEEEPLR